MNINIDFEVRNCAIRFDCLFTVSFGNLVQGLSLNLELDISFSGESNYGYAMLPRIASIGGVIPPGYGVGTSMLPRLTSTGFGGLYVPPAPEYGFAYLPYIVSFGRIKTSRQGTASATLKKLISKGGVAGFGESRSFMPSLVSYGLEGYSSRIAYAIESIRLQTGMYFVQDFIALVLGDGSLVSTFTGSREAIARIAESIQADATYTTLETYVAHLMEELSGTDTSMDILNSLIGLDPTARVWVVNLDTGASSQYDNYGFNSFFERAGEYYGVASDGIYKLDGPTDAGTNIDASVQLGRMSLNVPNKKRIVNVYIGTNAANKMFLKVDVGGTSYTYEARSSNTNLKNQRFDTGKGLYGNYHGLTILNQRGSDFDLETVTFEPVVLQRKI